MLYFYLHMVSMYTLINNTVYFNLSVSFIQLNCKYLNISLLYFFKLYNSLPDQPNLVVLYCIVNIVYIIC